ncbi:ECF transporter S component [Streptococcus pacificus]|uniref:Riboflavin transporter n=1 Tax=Streptococcus pacificus TaxID=2740577 RepID=A0ABS0ZJ99_9STRE|nr:ECF transporter S component [Streptococcus pacificus]MBJ8326077.1 ECF transporter S component [Streptococcus pacificus]
MIKTKKLAYVAILGALSFILMLLNFPIIPGAEFLKIDFSIIPVLIGLVLFDLKSAYIILLLRTGLKFFLNNTGVNDLIGLPMNVVATGVFILVFALYWNHKKSHKTYVISSILATAFLTLAMIILNIFYAIPLYAAFANFDIGQFIGVGKYIVAMVIPFNVVQGILFSVAFGIIYLSMKSFLESYKV